MPRLHLALLGPLEITLNGLPITDFESHSVCALLVRLAAAPERPHSRAALAEMLWPDRNAGAAAANLRHALANLRRILGDYTTDPTFPTFLLITRDTLQFNPRSDSWVDLLCFYAALREPDNGVERFRRMVALYRGVFLQDFALDGSPGFEEWLVVMREEVERLTVQALACLAGDAVQQEDWQQAAVWTRRQLAIEPWNEDAHRQLIWLLAMDGQRAAALHHFVLSTQLIGLELGVAPQAATLALVAQVRAEQVSRATLTDFVGKTLILPDPPQS